jgi:hypothetical protein
MQVPLQLMSGEAQDAPHVPEEQTVPAPQVLPGIPGAGLMASQSPDAPQYVGSVSGSMQRPPHFTWLLGQETMQLPPIQTCPPLQTAPELLPAVPVTQVPVAPQWVGSLLGSTHAPPQLMSGDAQDAPHVPEEQTVPAPQVLPALPGAGSMVSQSPDAPQ